MPEGIVNSVSDNGLFLYARKSFQTAGQDSFQDPPSQDADLFESLSNVMPPNGGGFIRRWGYELFNSPSQIARRLYEFQKDSATTERRIVLTNTSTVRSINEDGTTHNTGIITPGAGADNPRMLCSRDYAFFADGVSADLKKWNGASSSGTSKWGIDAPTESTSTSLKTLPGTTSQTVTSLVDWAGVGNITATDDTYATVSLVGGQTSEDLQATNWSFAIPSTATIVQVQIEWEWKIPAGANISGDQFVYLLYSGGTYAQGTPLAFTSAGVPEAYYSVTIPAGGLTPADVNASTFGAATQFFHYGSGTAAISVDHVKITVYYSTSNITISSVATAGAVTLVSGRKYFCVYQNTTTGHISGLNEVSASSGPVTSKRIDLTTIPVSTDSQVNGKIVLATADGGDETLLYEVVKLANATTTYNDDIPEATLLTRNIYLEIDEFGNERGVSFNTPPPNGDFPIKHRGRVFLAVGQLAYYSKNIAELTTSTGLVVGRYEEAFPADYYIDVSPGAETIKGWLSDGDALYIGTERHIRRLLGDGPDSFQAVEFVFNNIGIASQDTWVQVFTEGAPAGTIWLTPDFRVIWSDFNTYKDIGEPVQDLLNTISRTYLSKAWAIYHGNGAYDLFKLVIATGANTEPNLELVYDLRAGKWVTWTPTDSPTAGLSNIKSDGTPQLIFGAATGKLYKFSTTAVQDRVSDTPVSFTATIQTTFQDFGDPFSRKVLDEMEIVTGDSGLLTTIVGASTAAEFDSPTAVVTSSALTTSPLGEYKVYLAGSTTEDRSYRFKFVSTGTNTDLLRAYRVVGTAVHYA